MRFRLRDIDGKATVAVVYTGSKPDLFRPGRHVYLKGRLQQGTFVGERNSLVTKCPSKYVPKKHTLTHGRARARGAHRLPRPLRVRASWQARSRRGRAAAASPRPRRTRSWPRSPPLPSRRAVLAVALVRHDFSFVYVADFTSEKLPLGYTLSAFWGGQAGSLLLWLLVLTGMCAAAVLFNRYAAREVIAWAVPVLGLVAAFFAFLLVAVASPFETQVAPADGAGLNPSLQNPYMVAHPPMLYLGYVGLTIPFAFAMGALLAGRTDERWIVATRRWTLAAWAFLGFGQLLGAHWAYVEVGWGGYFAWDPVENAALMPWLAATAFLHSVMVQEKKGMLKVWNVLLVILSFCLAIFGTFLTRSGIVNSIHSFTQSSIGPWFLGFIITITLGSIALVVYRLPLLRAKTKLESAISREAAFLYNNLLLVALCLTILWGVVFPIVSEARPRRVGDGGAAVLQLLPAGVRDPAAAADGDRAARRLAAGVDRLVEAHAGLAGARRARRPEACCSCSAPAIVAARPRDVHVQRLRAGVDRHRVREGHAGASCAHRGQLVGRVLGARGAEPAALRRLRRPCGDRAARDRRRRLVPLPDDA